MKTPLFYKDKPLFGFDIGHNTIKIVQLERERAGKVKVLGYGYNTFSELAIQDGVITDIEAMAAAAHPLITQLLVGHITTGRVAVSIPAARSFTRILTLPYMQKTDLAQAVRLEVEQYVPVPLDDLYVDYQVNKVIGDAKKPADRQIEVVMVAASKKIIDSYLALFDVLDLEVALIETSLLANARAFAHSHPTAKPMLQIDFGARSANVDIFDGAVRVTGTVDGGGESLTELIAKAFKVTPRQAYILKTRYGLKPGPKQKEIITTLAPVLEAILKEISKMMRYYKDREAKGADIDAIVISGGGANLPGLAEYLTAKSKIKTAVDNPWAEIDFGRLQQPHSLESTIYTTAIGLAFASGERRL